MFPSRVPGEYAGETVIIDSLRLLGEIRQPALPLPIQKSLTLSLLVGFVPVALDVHLTGIHQENLPASTFDRRLSLFAFEVGPIGAAEFVILDPGLHSSIFDRNIHFDLPVINGNRMALALALELRHIQLVGSGCRSLDFPLV